jgi:hypothetical protein
MSKAHISFISVESEEEKNDTELDPASIVTPQKGIMKKIIKLVCFVALMLGAVSAIVFFRARVAQTCSEFAKDGACLDQKGLIQIRTKDALMQKADVGWMQKFAAVSWRRVTFNNSDRNNAALGSLGRCLADSACNNGAAFGRQAAQIATTWAISAATAVGGAFLNVLLPGLGTLARPLLNGLFQGFAGRLLGGEEVPPVTQEDLDQLRKELTEELQSFARRQVTKLAVQNIITAAENFMDVNALFLAAVNKNGFNIEELRPHLRDVCTTYELTFTNMQVQLDNFRNAIRNTWRNFLVYSKAASKLLGRFVVAVTSWQTALRVYYATCFNFQQRLGVRLHVQRFAANARGYVGNVRQWYREWWQRFRQNVQQDASQGGWGSGTATPNYWQAQCTRSGGVPSGAACRWQGMPNNPLLSCNNPRQFRTKREYGGGRDCSGRFTRCNRNCRFPTTFTFSVCEPGESCSDPEDQWINIRGWQKRSQRLRRTRDTGFWCVMDCQAVPHYNPDGGFLRQSFDYLVDWMRNQVRANMIMSLAPMMLLNGHFSSAKTDSIEVIDSSFKTVLLGPISYQVLSMDTLVANPRQEGARMPVFRSCNRAPGRSQHASIPCESEDLSVLDQSCQKGIAAVSVFFGSRGDAWQRGIAAVSVYEANTTSGEPSKDPCHVFFESSDLRNTNLFGADGGVYSSLTPDASMYTFNAMRFRRLPQHLWNGAAVGMVEFEFAVRETAKKY